MKRRRKAPGMQSGGVQAKTNSTPCDPWPHRVAWVLACGAFLAICTGGLVTSFTAGMAVPNRSGPGVTGLFTFYPPGDWLTVWDVFLEHSHRLVGAIAALVAVVLAVLVWLRNARKSTRWLAVAAVATLLIAMTIGGLQVLRDEVLLARAHAWLAPAVFALCGALVTVTSPRWLDRTGPEPDAAAPWLRVVAAAGIVGVYLQVLLGAQLRHVAPEGTADRWFELWVWLHLIGVALLVTVMIALLAMLLLGKLDRRPAIARWAWLLLALFLVQLVLGVTAWVTTYGWPRWFVNYVLAIEYTVVAEGRLQTLVTTTHVAVGALSLMAATSLTLWSQRLPGRSVKTGAR